MIAVIKGLSRVAGGIVAAAILALAVGFAAFFGTRLATGPPAPPIAVKSLGPTVRQLERMGQLATMRVVVTDVLSAEGDGYRGVWLIKGDALLSCDLARARIVARDDEKRTAKVWLPTPQVLSPRVDHEKTRTWSVAKATWIPWRWGDQDVFRDSAMFHAQKLVAAAATSGDYVGQAKAQTDLLIQKTYHLVGWTITIEWESVPAP
jgi:hypothetical protein